MKSALSPAVLQAPAYLVAAATVFGLMLHTKHQSRRKCWLPFYLALSIQSVRATKHLAFYPPLISLWTQAMTLCVLWNISLLFIEKCPAPRPRIVPANTSKGLLAHENCMWKIRVAYRLWGNPRMYRVRKEEADNEYLKSDRIESQPPQSLSVFLLLRTAKLLLYYAFYYHIHERFFDTFIISVLPSDVTPSQRRFFRPFDKSFSSYDLILRTHTATYWILESIIFLDGAHAALGIFFVLVGLDEPEDWPIFLFGSITDATSLSRFWSRFWHPLAMRPYKSYGTFIATRCLGLQPRRHTLTFNTVVAFIVFLLSGITHALTMCQCGLTRDWYLEIVWFQLNFLGCFVEKAIAKTTRSLAKQTGYSRQLKTLEESWVGQVVGYAWVFGFFFLTVPWWKYPRMEMEAIARERWADFMDSFRVGG